MDHLQKISFHEIESLHTKFPIYQLFNKINKANQNNKVDRYQKNHYPLINQNKTQLVFCIFLYLNIKKSVIK